MKPKPSNWIDPDNHWVAPNSNIDVDWTTPEARLLYDPAGNIISTMPLKFPIGYNVTPR